MSETNMEDEGNSEVVNVDNKVADIDADHQPHNETKESSIGMKAPDGGYGWFVVLGCFLSHCVIGGLDRSDGVFFLQFLDKFGQSAQLTAWPVALVSAIRFVMGPITSAVCNRYSARSSVIVGGFLIALSCILNGMAPNFYFLFFSHALMAGIGGGLSYAPGLIIVGMYFDSKRSLSAGLGSSGVGVGTFLFVPTAQYLFDNYGFQGAFLIIGGYALNMILVAMLYRPLSMNDKFVKHFTLAAGKDTESMDVEDVVLSDVCELSDKSSSRLQSTKPAQNRMHQLPEIQNLTGSCTDKVNSNDSLAYKHGQNGSCLISSLKIFFPTEHRNKDAKVKKKLFHFYLLKNPSFMMYCISIWLFTMASKAAFTFIPALVKSRGISESRAALVLSVTGVADTMGRIGTGILLDSVRLRPLRPLLYNMFMLIVCSFAFILPHLESFSSFCALCFFYGLFVGAYIAQKSVILVDILDVKHMANSFGILICFQGLGTLMGPPLSGALKDYFGSYDVTFYLGGGLMTAAAICMLTGNVILRLQKRRRI